MLSTYSALVLLCLLGPVAQAFSAIGCFSSVGDLTDQGPHVFQSLGYCRNTCRRLEQPVIGVTNATNCFCGSSLPPVESIVDDSECNLPCPGYPMNICGGRGFISISIAEPVSETLATSTSTAQSETVHPGTAHGETAHPESAHPETVHPATVQPDTEGENVQAVVSPYS